MSRRAVDIRERYTGAHYAQPARGGRDADRRWFLLAVALSGTLVLLSVAVLLALLDRRASAAPAVPRSLGPAAAVVVAVSAGDSAADPAAGVAGLLADGPAPRA